MQNLHPFNQAHLNIRYQKRGFTLVEVLLVLGIIGILAALSIPFYENYADKTRSSTAVSDIARISKSIDLYYSVNGSFPDSLADVYMDTLTDPWGNPYVYTNIANTKGKGALRKDRNLVPINTDYDLYSKGPDGKSSSPLTASSSHDDIIRASNGSFVGIAEDY